MPALIQDYDADDSATTLFGAVHDDEALDWSVSNGHCRTADLGAATGATTLAPSTQTAVPRMVSLPSMSQVSDSSSSSSHRKRSSSTPYEDLRRLAMTKQKQHCQPPFVGTQVPRGNTQRTPGVLCLDLPGFHFESPPANKRIRVQDDRIVDPPLEATPLHQACLDGDVKGIAEQLKKNAAQAARAARTTRTKNVYNFGTNKMESKTVQENYTFALNLAIRAQVDNETLDSIAGAAPGVLIEPDGSAAECPLSLLLKTSPHNGEAAAQLILRNPNCVRVQDRNGNLPLHIACRYGASLHTVRQLVILYPEAIFLKNRFGESPVLVAQRSIHLCTEEVARYLWEKQADAL